MIGVWCLANFGSVHSLFLDQLVALMNLRKAQRWRLVFGRLLGGLIVAIFWGIFLPIQILWVVYKLSQAKKQASVF